MITVNITQGVVTGNNSATIEIVEDGKVIKKIVASITGSPGADGEWAHAVEATEITIP